MSTPGSPAGLSPTRFGATRFGVWTAAIVFVADQISKLWILFWVRLEDTGPWLILPFVEFVMVWNRGISYGLFQQSTEFGRWALVVLSIAASIWLSWWLMKAVRRREALALGLIIGGALGNLVDRVAYGAVADFVHVFVGRFSWYVFNIADAAIVVGVVLLMYDTFTSGSNRAA